MSNQHRKPAGLVQNNELSSSSRHSHLDSSYGGLSTGTHWLASSAQVNRSELAVMKNYIGTSQLGLGQSWTLVVSAIALIALGITGYLSYVSLSASAVMGCGGSVFDCSHVLTSKWSKIFGIPVSIPAFVLYLALLTAAWAPKLSSSAGNQFFAMFVLMTCAFTAAAAGIWFVTIQIFSVEHLCPYCLAAHSCGLALGAIMLWKNPIGVRSSFFAGALALISVGFLSVTQTFSTPADTFEVETHDSVPALNDQGDGTFDAPFLAPVEAPGIESESKSNGESDSPNALFDAPGQDTSFLHRFDRSIARGSVMYRERPSRNYHPVSSSRDLNLSAVSFLVGMRGTAVFVSVTANESTNTGRNQVQESGSTGNTTEQDQEGETQDEAKPQEEEQPRIVSLRGGAIQLNAAHWPIVGKPKARYIFVEMFDYTCGQCRETHIAIKGAQQALGDDLAVILLPVPMNTACNKHVTANHPVHANACELAKLAVAVWRVDASKLNEFHDWMFDGNKAPSTADAKARASDLVGAEKLDAELAKDIVNQFIAKHTELYNRVGSGVIPKMIFPRSTVIGKYTSTNALIEMIKREAN